MEVICNKNKQGQPKENAGLNVRMNVGVGFRTAMQSQQHSNKKKPRNRGEEKLLEQKLKQLHHITMNEL